ncbi:MAG TPA: CoB--CoM heterodisulfide reductase iron-sulfur subunit B family protein [Ignavibacteria bacterium]
MKYLYYPGCSLKCTGRSYEESLLAVFKVLGIDYVELDDWNCCGATAYMAVDETKAFAIASRNLALAEQQFKNENEINIIAPCSACYMVLLKTQNFLAQNETELKKIKYALKESGLNYEGKVKIRHPLDVLVNDFGINAITKAVKHPLKGIRAASYYGCQTVRPYATFDDARDPSTMDKIVKAIGAEPVDWPLKTRCCGASLTGTVEQVGLPLCHSILYEAIKKRADVIITSCPLCQFNLECYQTKINKKYNQDLHIGVIYFTQLLGLALGILPPELGMNRLFVKPESVYKSVGGGAAIYV